TEAGITTLYTSEPTTRITRPGGCLVLGRYSIHRGMSAAAAADLAAGRRLARWRQALWWNVKKAAKAVAGPAYPALRHWLLTRASRPDSTPVKAPQPAPVAHFDLSSQTARH